MLVKGMAVKVYDGDLIGWTDGTLEDKYFQHNLIEKWSIKTNDGSLLVRFIKSNYKELRTDGCGYII